MSTGLTPDLGDPDVLAHLFAPAQHHEVIGLAVSGGGDSVGLMVLAQRWAAQLHQPPRLIVYSLDHGLRPEAADEVAMVLSAAASLGLEARGLRWDDIKAETTTMEAARQARYRLIGQAMREDGATLLLTAHHRSDQAETILMRLAHGSGLEGLRGMAASSLVEGTPVFRPFLDVDPAALAVVARQAGLIPVEDPSNSDPHYERARWRKLLPLLAAEGLDAATISRFAVRIAEADTALAEVAEDAFSQLVRLDGFGAANLPRDEFVALSPAIAQRVLARVLNTVGGRQKPRALGQVERLHEQLRSEAVTKPLTLLGTVIRPRNDHIIVCREPGRMLPADVTLPPGSELVWDQRFLITNSATDRTVTITATDFLPRHRLEALLGFKVTTPAEAIRTAPMVRDAGGELMALGGWSFDETITVTLLIE